MIEQLIQLCVLETRKKYNLSSDGVVQLPPITLKTDLYTVAINCDLHHAHIEWKLKLSLLRKKLEPISDRKGVQWGFFGYVKEKPFALNNIKSAEDVYRNADISSKESGRLSFRLKGGIPHSALFFVMFDTDRELVLDSDIATMIQLPQVPSIDQISELKAKLQRLIGSSAQISSNSRSTAIKQQFVDAAKSIVDYRKEIKKFGFNDEEVESLSQDFKERLDQILFS